MAASGPALVQSHVGITELPEDGLGRLEVVCVLNDGFMEHFSRAPGPGASWQSEGTFGESGAHGPPCMIEGQWNCPIQVDAVTRTSSDGFDRDLSWP